MTATDTAAHVRGPPEEVSDVQQLLLFDCEPPPLPPAPPPAPAVAPNELPPIDIELAQRIAGKVALKLMRTCADLRDDLEVRDLRQEALVGILSSYPKYNPRRAALSTFCWWAGINEARSKIRSVRSDRARAAQHGQKMLAAVESGW